MPTTPTAQLAYRDDVRCPLDFKLGFTNIVDRPTPGSDGLQSADFDRGRIQLREKLVRWRPRVACFVGYGVYQAYIKASGGQAGGDHGQEGFADTLIPVPPTSTTTSTTPSKPPRKGSQPPGLVQDRMLVHGSSSGGGGGEGDGGGDGDVTRYFVMASTSARPTISKEEKLWQFQELCRVVHTLRQPSESDPPTRSRVPV